MCFVTARMGEGLHYDGGTWILEKKIPFILYIFINCYHILYIYIYIIPYNNIPYLI